MIGEGRKTQGTLPGSCPNVVLPLTGELLFCCPRLSHQAAQREAGRESREHDFTAGQT